MKKNYNEVMALSNTLAMLSQQKHPFSVLLAKNIRSVDTILTAYNKLREDLVDKYAMRDEEGNLLGIYKPIDLNKKKDEMPKELSPPAKDKADEKVKKSKKGKPGMERVEDPKLIDDIEWNDKEAFMKDLEELNKKEVELEISPVDVAKTFLHVASNKEMTIEDYINTHIEAGLVLFLDDYSFFAGLAIS